MTSITLYSVDDFERISFNGFHYTLPNETLKIISALAEQVGAPSYVRTPVFHKRHGEYNSITNPRPNARKRNRRQEVNDDDWDTIRNFQATEVNKKEGIDKSLDSLRKFLNKMTDKTYDINRDGIIELINGMEHASNEDLNFIGISIFNVASGNAFYSNVYATLYKDLMDKFKFMESIFDANFDDFTDLFENIEYCDAEVDYNKFCENNKTNDKRKAVGLFYVNLMKSGVLNEDKLFDIIEGLQTRVLDLIEQDNKRNEAEELTDNISVLTSNAYDILSKNDRWEAVFEAITLISNMKAKSLPSISNKIIFKHLDMLDVLK